MAHNDGTFYFPMCPSTKCWCYECAMKCSRTSLKGWDKDDYEAHAKEYATKICSEYLATQIRHQAETNSKPVPPEDDFLGEPMAKNTWKTTWKTQFPLCPSQDCWCYDCSKERSKEVKSRYLRLLYS